MKEIKKYDFSNVKKSNSLSENQEGIKYNWKCIEVETTIPELKSIFYEDNTVIDYDGRGPGNWRDFKENLEKMLLGCAEDEMIKSMGSRQFLNLKGTNESHYEATLESAKRIVKDNKLHVVFMARDSFVRPEFDQKPFVRMAFPYDFDLSERIGDLIEENWGKSLKKRGKGFILFDATLDVFPSEIDIDYLKSVPDSEEVKEKEFSSKL